MYLTLFYFSFINSNIIEPKSKKEWYSAEVFNTNHIPQNAIDFGFLWYLPRINSKIIYDMPILTKSDLDLIKKYQKDGKNLTMGIIVNGPNYSYSTVI